MVNSEVNTGYVLNLSTLCSSGFILDIRSIKASLSKPWLTIHYLGFLYFDILKIQSIFICFFLKKGKMLQERVFCTYKYSKYARHLSSSHVFCNSLQAFEEKQKNCVFSVNLLLLSLHKINLPVPLRVHRFFFLFASIKATHTHAHDIDKYDRINLSSLDYKKDETWCISNARYYQVIRDANNLFRFN